MLETQGTRRLAAELLGRDRPPARAAESWCSLAADGLVGATAMMAWMTAAASLQGDGALAPLRAVGSAFRGAEALPGGIGTIAWAAVLHLAVGAALGVLFGEVLPPVRQVPGAMVLGAALALGAMALAIELVLPHVAPVLRASMPRHGGAWVIAHAVFGAATATAPCLRRRLRPGLEGLADPAAHGAGALHPHAS
jgi:hypothetical protein